MQSINRSMSLTEWVLLIFLSLLWGGSFFFIEVAVAALPPFTLVAARLVLGAALSYAFAGVFGRRFQKMDITPMGTATGQITASAVMMVPIAMLFETPWTIPVPDWEVWGAVLGLAIFSTALAYILYFRILATAGATNLLLVTFLIPVSAILLGTFVLGEQLLTKHFIGMGLLGMGLMIIDGRFPKYISRKITRVST